MCPDLYEPMIKRIKENIADLKHRQEEKYAVL